jgi:RNA polymerase sigma-70 factor (ECF subfamily)
MSGIKKTFSDIYDGYVNKIYRFIFLKVGTKEVTEDLTSEVFSRLWKKLQSKEAIENINAFLYRVANNLVTDYYREKGKAQFVPIEILSLAEEEVSAETRIAVQADMEQVRAALAELKDEYRDSIIWYYLDELSVREIAKMTKKSEEAVRVTIHRALQALRERLGNVE